MATTLIRTCILYFATTIALRLMGKRQIGEMEPSELAITILISELAAIPMQDMGKPVLSGLIPILTLVGLEILLSAVILKSSRLRTLFEGNPAIMVRDGKILERALRKNRLTTEELTEALRTQGISDFSTVQYAILETNGQLSVMLYEAYKPVTARMMGINADDGGLARVIVSDGHVNEKNLLDAGLDRQWLDGELKARSVDSPGDVFLMTRDDMGRIYFLKREKGGSK